jgi:hypothetical protein
MFCGGRGHKLVSHAGWRGMFRKILICSDFQVGVKLGRCSCVAGMLHESTKPCHHIAQHVTFRPCRERTE